MGESIPSPGDSGMSRIDPELIHRFKHQLDLDAIANQEIDDMALVSKALDEGWKPEEIIEFLGGREEVERRLGTKGLQELEEKEGEA